MKGGSHRLLIAGQARSLAGLFPGKFQSNLLNDNKFVTLMTEALKQFELLKTAE